MKNNKTDKIFAVILLISLIPALIVYIKKSGLLIKEITLGDIIINAFFAIIIIFGIYSAILILRGKQTFKEAMGFKDDNNVNI